MGNDKDFNIIASLNIPKSTSQIEADLKDVLGRCDIVIHAEPCGHEEEVLIVD